MKPYTRFAGFICLPLFSMAITACTLHPRSQALNGEDGPKISMDPLEGDAAFPVPRPQLAEIPLPKTHPEIRPTSDSTIESGAPTSNIAPAGTTDTETSEDDDSNPRGDLLAKIQNNDDIAPEGSDPSANRNNDSKGETSNPASPKKHFTGFAKKKAELGYTDASTDFLMPFLKKSLKDSLPVGASAADKALDFARSLRRVKLIPVVDNNISIEITYRPYGQTQTPNQTLRLQGRLAANSFGEKRWAQLSQKESLNRESLKTDKTAAPATEESLKGLTGELHCLDQTIKKSCQVYHLGLKLDSKVTPYAAEVILRHTNLSLNITPPQSPTNVAQKLVDLFKNTSSNDLKTTTNKFTKLEMETFAVVQGRSEFEIKMFTEENEVLYFQGLLVAGINTSTLSIPLTVAPDTNDPALAHWAPTANLDLTKTMGSAHLIENDGLGTLTIKMDLKKEASSNTEEAFVLRFQSENPKLLELNKDTVYSAK